MCRSRWASWWPWWWPGCWSRCLACSDGSRLAVTSLLGSAGKVAENTSNIPQLEATAPVLEQIAAEGVVQDGYMNALSQGYGEPE